MLTQSNFTSWRAHFDWKLSNQTKESTSNDKKGELPWDANWNSNDSVKIGVTSRLILVLYLIGWGGGLSFLDQSQCEEKSSHCHCWLLLNSITGSPSLRLEKKQTINLRKWTTLLKTCFDSSSVVEFKVRNLKCVTKCWLDKTNNSNGTMKAFTRKVLN